jgi:sugar/nucleoside kinase (ribokinase family)
MAKLRRENSDMVAPVPGRPLRIVASGTLFLTHTLSLPTYPAPSTVVRAHSVTKTRGGSASTLLSLLAQFSRVEAFLVAPLSGNDEGKMILRDLEREGVTTRYCKIWKGAGVPSAWVLESGSLV